MRLGLVVEGHGEVRAVPVLVRRLAIETPPGFFLEILPPMRIPKTKLLKEGEVEKAVEFLARRTGPRDAILIVIDGDDDCGPALGVPLLARARVARPDRRIAVAVANREYEAWFIAAAESLRGVRVLAADLAAPPFPEEIRGAKEWLERRKSGGYAETTDQVAFTARMDLAMAGRAASFARFRRIVRELVRG